jgi:hypothetical protein
VLQRRVTRIDFRTGGYRAAAVPLSEASEGGRSLYDGDTLVTLTIRWPQHFAVKEERNEWLACLARVERELMTPEGDLRSDVTSARQAAVLSERDEANIRYLVAVVESWNLPEPCTPASVRELYLVHPWAMQLVADALGEKERFFPSASRPAVNESAPASEVVA